MSGKVLVTVPLPAPFAQTLSDVDVEIIGRIPGTDELCDRLRTGDYSVLCSQLQDPVTAEVLDAGAGSLRAVCNYAVGYNNIDVAAATERGIAVTNTPGVLTAATADLAIALMLAVSRRLVEGDEFVRAGKFEGWGPGVMLGRDLNGAQLGVIGFGRIGQAVARRALAFGMRVVYSARDSVVVEEDLRGLVSPMPFDELLSTSDVISLHAPLTEGTRHLIDAAAIEAMKPSAILINTARGPIVDEMALVSALQHGRIFGAGLDVFEKEPALAPGLSECRNAVLVPHVGSATVQTRSAMAEMVAANARAALAGETPPQCLNPAEYAWLGRPLF